MKKVILFSLFTILLSGCNDFSEEPVPHNRISSKENAEESILFSFEETNRFSKTDLSLGIPKVQLMNSTFQALETDFSLSVDQYNDGWQEIETINYFVKAYPYALHRNETLTYSLFADHFNQPLEAGRYRLRLDFELIEADQEEADHTIGAVFWVTD